MPPRPKKRKGRRRTKDEAEKKAREARLRDMAITGKIIKMQFYFE
jgi:hypothetical protein